jgi:DNA-binding transcriptional LysR family regulator
MFKIQQLRQFVIAAAGGSFKNAAAATFRSQAAVSIAVRELEKTIGAPLLEPDHRGVFTPLAKALLPMFQELLSVHDRVYSQSRQLAQGDHGSLSIAAPPFLTEKWLPDLIPGFIERHPGVRVRTIEESSSRICRLVTEGMATIGIAGLLADDPKLNITPIVTDSYGVLCSPKHPFARKRIATWASLRGERIIGSDASEMLLAAGLAASLPAPDLVITSRAPLLACVRQNIGITILPQLARPRPLDGFVFVPLTHPKLSRVVAIVTRRGESLLPAAKWLEELLTKSLRELALSGGAKLASAKRDHRFRSY